MNLSNLWNREKLNQPVEDTSLQWFRMGFGLLLAYYFVKSMVTGLLHLQYIRPKFQFTYSGFEWVTPLPGAGMYWIYTLLAIVAVFLAFGWLYRLAAITLFLGYCYVFLLDVARYQNHIYFVLLLCLFFVFIPHPGTWRQRFGRQATHPGTIQRWWLWLFQFQIGIVYFFGGIAKINSDWLIRSEPMTTWLHRDMSSFIPDFLINQVWFPFFMSWSGMLLDLLMVPALVWRRSRNFAMIAMLAFHLSNAIMFNISIFPMLMIWATFLFWEPSWPRRFLGFIRRQGNASANPNSDQNAITVKPLSRWVFLVLGIYCLIQILLPLRHWIYPGNVSWTDEGHRFAWRMKLREKQGTLQILVLDRDTGTMIQTKPENLLDRRQISKMTHDPHLIRQFCEKLAKRLKEEGKEHLEIKVISSVSLNGRVAQPLVDMTANMAALPHGPSHGVWITPLRPSP